MKLIDAIRRVKRPEPRNRWEFSSPIPEMTSDFGLHEIWDYPEEVDNRLKSYPIFSWLCTDETVGLYAIYLDDEPVGAHYRSARKNGYQFMWLSRAAGEKVRAFLVKFIEPDAIDIIDPNIPISEFPYYGETDGVINVEPV